MAVRFATDNRQGERSREILLLDYETTFRAAAVVRPLLEELGSVETTSSVADQSLVESLKTVNLVVVVAGADSLWRDLPRLAENVRQDALAFVLPFGEEDYPEFARRVGDVFGVAMPRFVACKRNKGPIQGVLWFRGGVAEMASVSGVEWGVARSVAGRTDSVLGRLLLDPVVARNGMSWAELSEPGLARWTAGLYAPLLLGVAGLALFLTIRKPAAAAPIPYVFTPEGMKAADDEEKATRSYARAVNHWDQEAMVAQFAHSSLDTSNLTLEQVIQLAGLQKKMYAAADEEECEGLASGAKESISKVLGKLTVEDVDAYFKLRQDGMQQPDAHVEDGISDAALLARAGKGLTPADQRRLATIGAGLRVGRNDLPIEDQCWFDRTLAGQYDRLRRGDVAAIAQRVGF